MSAQAGNCAPAKAEAFLDAGNVRARIFNNGALFWNGSPYVYEVPKGGGVNSIFAASFMIAGIIDGELRGAASRYGPREFWPGPLDVHGNPPNDCFIYDKIWEITSKDINTFMETRVAPENLINWPWHLGAPVVDGDGNPENYNLAGGDLPELFGDQRLWWIMNDRGNIHEATKSEPVGLEVHASAHVFNHTGVAGHSTFYDYKIINKNKSPFTDAYWGIFADTDLGNFDDDYVGSDSLLHLGYTYNADDMDEGEMGYQQAPPALGVTILKSAKADNDDLDNDRDGIIDEPNETLGMSSFFYFDRSRTYSNAPSNIFHYYYFMQARWTDGERISWGGAGRNFSTIPANFLFPGDPVTGEGWSELNPDPINGTQFPIDPSDRRSYTSSGPFTIASNDTLHIRFAIVWSRGTSNLDSVTRLKDDVRIVHQSLEDFYGKSRSLMPQKPSPPQFHLGFDQNFPNPFSESTNLRYSLPQSMWVSLAVYDVLGREVAMLVDAQQEAGIYAVDFNAGNLPIGVYYARIQLDHLHFTKRMVLVK